MNKAQSKSLLPYVSSILIAGIVLIAICAYQIRITEFGVITTLGKPVVVTDPGLYFRLPWPIQKVVKFDKRVHLLTGAAKETSTRDNINLIVSVFTVWRIADPLQYFNSVGNKYEAELLLKSLVEGKQEIVVRNYLLSDFTSKQSKVSKLGAIEAEFLESVQGQAKKLYGVKIDAIGFSQISLTEENTTSVLDRMKQEQAKIAAEIRSTSEKEAKIIRDNADSQKAQMLAQAEAEAKKIRGEALIKAAEQYDKFKDNLDFAIFLRKLDALEETMKTKTTIILDPKTPPFDLLQLDLKEPETKE